jgi:hypothetical protein
MNIKKQIKKSNQIKNLILSFNLLKKNPFYLVLPILLDIIFLLSIGFSGNYLTKQAMPFFERYAALQSMQLQANLINTNNPTEFLNINAEIMQVFTKIVSIFAKVILAIVVLWIIFQGLNWILASKATKKKISYLKFYRNFSILTFLWLIFFGTISAFFIKFTARSALTQSILLSSPIVNLITIFFLIITTYLLFIGYSNCYQNKLKEVFIKIYKIGFIKFKSTIPAFLIIFILFLIINFVLKLLSSLNPSITIVIGMFLIMPLLSFSRVYLINCLEKVKK